MTAYKNNLEIAVLFRSIADLLATQRANPYRVRAYRRAADSLWALDKDVEELCKQNALEDIDGIGKDLSEKIKEFLKTGAIQTLDDLRRPLPSHIRAWAALPGLSESLVTYIHGRLNIQTLSDLDKLVRSHMLKTLPGFSGSEQNLIEAIEDLQRRLSKKKDEVP